MLFRTFVRIDGAPLASPRLAALLPVLAALLRAGMCGTAPDEAYSASRRRRPSALANGIAEGCRARRPRAAGCRRGTIVLTMRGRAGGRVLQGHHSTHSARRRRPRAAQHVAMARSVVERCAASAACGACGPTSTHVQFRALDTRLMHKFGDAYRALQHHSTAHCNTRTAHNILQLRVRDTRDTRVSSNKSYRAQLRRSADRWR